MDKPIEIQKKRRPALLLSLVMLVTGGAAEWLLIKVIYPHLEGYFNLKVTAVVLIAALIIWTIVMVFKQSNRSKPGLVISAEGINDASNLASVGFIPWRDITGLKLTANEFKSALIVVLVKEPQAYVDKTPKMREARYAQFKQFGSPVVITAGVLEYDPQQLVALLQNHITPATPPKLP